MAEQSYRLCDVFVTSRRIPEGLPPDSAKFTPIGRLVVSAVTQLHRPPMMKLLKLTVGVVTPALDCGEAQPLDARAMMAEGMIRRWQPIYARALV